MAELVVGLGPLTGNGACGRAGARDDGEQPARHSEPNRRPPVEGSHRAILPPLTILAWRGRVTVEILVVAQEDAPYAEDLALARACIVGDEAAWERFVADYRPILYAAARALTHDEAAARELADSLWAELYGVGRTRASVEPGTERRSLLEYFHGRAKLSTWLRSVLAQRHVDTVRATRRLDSLTDIDLPDGGDAAAGPDLDDARYRAWFDAALRDALERLDAPDRLRLGLYYVQRLTLAQIGRATREHEATVSRKLARSRQTIRRHVEATLTAAHHLTPAEVESCYRAALDAGTFDLSAALGATGGAL